MRIVIAEDSVLLREGIARLLSDAGCEIIAAVGDGPALVAAIVAHRPDIAIVDVRMPPSHRDEGLRAALEARRRVPGSPILILSQYVEERYAGDYSSRVSAELAICSRSAWPMSATSWTRCIGSRTAARCWTRKS